MSQNLQPTTLTNSNKLARLLWTCCWLFLYRPTPKIAHYWRVLLLRLFGGKIAATAHPYPSVQIWAPWNLEMANNSCIAEGVICYNVNKVFIGEKATVSQYSHLCTASRDYTKSPMPLTTAPIKIEANAWITADVFIGPGVVIGEGSVVTARSSVFSDIPPWVVARGNPARPIRDRTLS